MVKVHVSKNVDQAFFTRSIQIGREKVVNLDLVVWLYDRMFVNIFDVALSFFADSFLSKCLGSWWHQNYLE